MWFDMPVAQTILNSNHGQITLAEHMRFSYSSSVNIETYDNAKDSYYSFSHSCEF